MKKKYESPEMEEMKLGAPELLQITSTGMGGETTEFDAKVREEIGSREENPW